MTVSACAIRGSHLISPKQTTIVSFKMNHQPGTVIFGLVTLITVDLLVVRILEVLIQVAFLTIHTVHLTTVSHQILMFILT